MKNALITSLFLACPWTALSDEGADIFAHLETKIEAQLKKGDFHPASQAAIRAQWADYKKAHTKPINQGEFRGAMFACGLLCPSVDVRSIVDYSGAYVYKSMANHPDAPGPHLKIEVTDDNRVFVLMDSRRIPAVVNNKIIFFTDGGFIREKAQFSPKAFASLNIEMIYRAKGVGMVMGPTHAVFDDLSPLLSFEGKGEKIRVNGQGDPKQAPRVDSSTSGPVHPNTEEATKKSLKAIGRNAPEELRVHPANHKNAPEVKPGNQGSVSKAAQFFDDGAFRKLQIDQALALRKKGHLIKANELGKQLKRKSVQLTLPKADSPASPLSLSEIYRKCSQSIFSIAEVRDCEGCGKTHVTPYGTAFAVTADGVLLTNYHLIESLGPNSRMVATAVDGTTYPVVEVLAASKIDDAAAIRIGGSGFIPLALSTDNVAGKRVSVISHPRGHLFSLSEGIVTRLFTQFSTRSMLISAEYAVGSSGAPVLDSSGNVLGMVAVTESLNDQMVLRGCIPSQSLLELITASGFDSPKPAPDPLAAERACLKETFAAMQQMMQQQGKIPPQEFTERLGVLNASMKHSAERCPDDPIAKRYLQALKLQGSQKTPAPGK